MKIGAKLAAGFGGVVFLMIILGVTGIIALKSVNRGYGIDVKNEELARNQAQRIKIGALQVRRNEKDFMARQNMKYFEQGNKHLDLVVKDAKALQELTSNQEIRTDLDSALQGVANYRALFANLVKASEERGLTEKLGLQGKFREKAHKLAEFMDHYHTENIRYWMLMLRRYEKDLNINSNDAVKTKKYMSKFKDSLQSYETAVKEARIKADVKNELIENMTQYSAALSRWSDGKADYDQVRAIVHEIENIIDAHYVADGNVLLLTLRKEEKDYMLRRNIKYIQRLENTAEKLRSNIESSKIDTKEKKEIITLLNSYHNGINDLKEKDIEINGFLNEMKQNADLVMELSEKIVDIAINSAEKLSEKIASSAGSAIAIVWIISALSLIIAVVFAYFFARSISIPLKRAVDFANRMSEGDLTRKLDIDRKDEIGEMANSMNTMTANMSAMIRGINADVSTLSDASSDLNSVAEMMTTGSENTVAKANTVASAAEEMNSNMGSVAAAMEEASTNVDTVAAAAEEMSANIGNIAKNAEQARQSTQNSVEKAGDASGQINELSKAADEIGAVTETIAAISDKTNLLALNATIEAARAGDAGKGFAVVANEIKDLAQQTAEATDGISRRLDGIQQSTANSVNGIKDISDAIQQVDTLVATITEAVEQQNNATDEIARNVSQASQGLQEINENVAQSSQAAGQVAQEITEVNEGANEISNSSAQVSQNASDLSNLAEKLKEQVGKFKF